MTVARDPACVTRPVLVPVLLVLAVLATAACSNRVSPEDALLGPEPLPGEPVPPSFEPVVFPRQTRGDTTATAIEISPRGEARAVDDVDAGWEEKHDLASGYAAGGYDEAALTVIAEALDQKPPPQWRERFLNLKTSLRMKRVESDWLRVQAQGTMDYVVFGIDVDWRIRIRNVSDRPLVLRAPATGPGRASPSALSLTIVRRDVDIYGAELERKWNQTVFLQRAGGCDIEIPPGGVHEATVRVPAEDVGGAISGLRILELAGTLRAVVTEVAGEPRTVGLRVRRGRVVVLPRGYEPLTPDPLASMQTAIDAVAPTHVLIATEFVARAQSDRAVDQLAQALATGDPALRTAVLGSLGLLRERNVGRPLARFATPLIDALGAHPDRAPPLMEALTIVSGQALAPDPRLWVDWWRRAERQGLTVQPIERSPPPGGGRREER